MDTVECTWKYDEEECQFFSIDCTVDFHNLEGETKFVMPTGLIQQSKVGKFQDL